MASNVHPSSFAAECSQELIFARNEALLFYYGLSFLVDGLSEKSISADATRPYR